jgi:hypothetical protein
MADMAAHSAVAYFRAQKEMGDPNQRQNVEDQVKWVLDLSAQESQMLRTHFSLQ